MRVRAIFAAALAVFTLVVPASAATSHDPIGHLDSVSMSATHATARGWADDPDVNASLTVYLYVDGTFRSSVLANLDRPDVAAATGRGSARGFTTALTLAYGRHSVCAVALNVGAGANARLGCASVYSTDSPVGALDTATASAAGVLTVGGWTFDPNSTASIYADVYVDGTATRRVLANGLRSDVDRIYHTGTNHGFAATVSGAAGGTHTVCVYGINVGAGGNSLLGCRTVSVAGVGASIAGCPLFPADNPWRRDVSHDPLDPHSAAWVANANGATKNLHPDFGSDPSYGIPYVVVPAAQVKVPITFTAYGDESDPGPYPVPLNAPVEAGGDRHVLVASGDCHLYELYNANRTGSGWSADAGAVFDLTSDTLRPDGWTSADAAGLPILPGLVRPDEIAAGHIDHALRFTIARSQKAYINPATHQAGSTTDPDVAPMGARFRLRASFDISRYTGASRIILQALKTYGMIVADNGSDWYISGATYTGWDDDDLNQLKSVPGSVFEVVSSGPLHY